MSLIIYSTEGDLPYPVNPPPFQYQQDQGQNMILVPLFALCLKQINNKLFIKCLQLICYHIVGEISA